MSHTVLYIDLFSKHFYTTSEIKLEIKYKIHENKAKHFLSWFGRKWLRADNASTVTGINTQYCHILQNSLSIPFLQLDQ